MKTKDLKHELDSIMASTAASQAFVEASLSSPSGAEPPELAEPEPLFTVDFDALRESLYSEAARTVESMARDVLPARYMQSRFIQRQMEIDGKALGAVYYQQELLMRVEEACIKSIAAGSLGPRMVEVTNATAENYTKHTRQASDMIALIRKNYIDIMLDIQQKENSERAALGASSQPMELGPGENRVYVGSKEVINSLKERKIRAARDASEKNGGETPG